MPTWIRFTLVALLLLGGAGWLIAPKAGAHFDAWLDELHAQCGSKADAECLWRERQLCRLGVEKACRRVAQALHCGRAVDVDLHGAAVAYNNACRSGDQYSCGYLAGVLLEGRADSRFEEQLTDSVRMHAAMALATGGGWDQAQAQRLRMKEPGRFDRQFQFIEAALAFDEGRTADARALAGSLIKVDGNDPAVRVLAVLVGVGIEAPPQPPDARDFAQSWIAAGAPDLRESSYLVAPREGWDFERCATPLFPAPSRSSDQVELLEALNQRPLTDPVTDTFLELAIRSGTAGDTEFVTRWAAAAWLSGEGLTTEQQGRAAKPLRQAVQKLAEARPSDPFFETWVRCLDPRPWHGLFPRAAKATSESRIAAFDVLAKVFQRPGRSSESDAFGAVLGLALSPDLPRCGDHYVELAAHPTVDAREVGVVLASLGEQVANRGWLVDAFVGGRLLSRAAELTGSSFDASMADAVLENARRLYPDGPTARMGMFPLPRRNGLWMRTLISNELEELTWLADQTGQ